MNTIEAKDIINFIEGLIEYIRNDKGNDFINNEEIIKFLNTMSTNYPKIVFTILKNHTNKISDSDLFKYIQLLNIPINTKEDLKLKLDATFYMLDQAKK